MKTSSEGVSRVFWNVIYGVMMGTIVALNSTKAFDVIAWVVLCGVSFLVKHYFFDELRRKESDRRES